MRGVLAAVLVGLGLAAGYNQIPQPQSAEPLAVAPPAAAAPAEKRVTAPVKRRATAPAAKWATTRPAPTFWQLTDDARKDAGADTGRMHELLKEALTRASPKAILRFARTRQQLDRRAYTWNLWAAAYVIEDGCSDDCFRDFRGYLISLGHSTYGLALRDPDSLASVVQDAETGNWESADNVAPDAYSSATGNDYPLDESDLSGRPRGRPFNENDIGALVQRFPQLAARFR